jgi:hypothetical protein
MNPAMETMIECDRLTKRFGHFTNDWSPRISSVLISNPLPNAPHGSSAELSLKYAAFCSG